MRKKIESIIKESIAVKQNIIDGEALKTIEDIALEIIRAIKNGGKILVFGNGGSAADAQHMAAELVGRFKKERKAVPAIALTTNTSTLTALSNDYGYDASFSRQVEAFGGKGDVAVAISTSGNAKNVIRAVETAKKMGMKTIALTGKGGGGVKEASDISLVVPSSDTARVQESHIVIIHAICELVEENL